MRRLIVGILLATATLGHQANGKIHMPADLITFEIILDAEPEDGMSIYDQFEASHGVRFMYSDGSLPKIARVGPPTTAFAGFPNDDGYDTVVPGTDVGQYFLTDDVSIGAPNTDLIIQYLTPVQAAGGDLLDLDGAATGQAGWGTNENEAWLITAFNDEGEEVSRLTVTAGDYPSGDGVATPWSITAETPEIVEIHFRYTGAKPIGYAGFALDNFTPSTPRTGFTVTQITDRDGGGPCASCCTIDHRQPMLNPEGTQLAFSSTWNVDDVLGSRNPERNRELFRYDMAAQTFVQDTVTTEGFSCVSDFEAGHLVFFSTSPEMGTNADMGSDIFAYEWEPEVMLVQHTDTIASRPTVHQEGECPLAWFKPEDWLDLSNVHADLSSDATCLVWASNQNIPTRDHPAGNNADGNYEIFWQDLGTRDLVQLTDTVDDSEAAPLMANLWPRTNSDGSQIIFVSAYDLAGHEALAPGEHSLYLAGLDGHVQRLTNARLRAEKEVPPFGVDSAGSRIVFASTTDILGSNPDGNCEIFCVETQTLHIAQLTSTVLPVVNSRPVISGDGTKVVFLSNADFSGDNADGSEELWLYNFREDVRRQDVFLQLTDLQETLPADADRFSWMDSIHTDGDGSYLVLCCNADLVGRNPQNDYEIFLLGFSWQPVESPEDNPFNETPPAAPVNLNAMSHDTLVGLYWDANLEPDLAGYNVYRASPDSPDFVKVNTALVTRNQFSDRDVINGDIYEYVVTAVDVSQNESDMSHEVTATPRVDATAPAIPQNLTATGADRLVGLYWGQSADEDLAGYNVYRSVSRGRDYTKVNSALVTRNEYGDLTVENDTTYYYVVTAVDFSGNESGHSNEAGATPRSPACGGVLLYPGRGIDSDITSGIGRALLPLAAALIALAGWATKCLRDQRLARK